MHDIGRGLGLGQAFLREILGHLGGLHLILGKNLIDLAEYILGGVDHITLGHGNLQVIIERHNQQHGHHNHHAQASENHALHAAPPPALKPVPLFKLVT